MLDQWTTGQERRRNDRGCTQLQRASMSNDEKLNKVTTWPSPTKRQNGSQKAPADLNVWLGPHQAARSNKHIDNHLTCLLRVCPTIFVSGGYIGAPPFQLELPSCPPHARHPSLHSNHGGCIFRQAVFHDGGAHAKFIATALACRAKTFS
jgi:hypothetical protein